MTNLALSLKSAPGSAASRSPAVQRKTSKTAIRAEYSDADVRYLKCSDHADAPSLAQMKSRDASTCGCGAGTAGAYPGLELHRGTLRAARCSLTSRAAT